MSSKMTARYLCCAHQAHVIVMAYGVFHASDGFLCSSAHVVTPSGPRPAEQLRAQAHLAEAAVAT